MDITFYQGTTATIDAKSLSSVFVMSDGTNKYTSDNVVSTDDGLKIRLDASVTSGFVPGKYDFQVFGADGLEKQGKLKVKPSLLYADSVESYWTMVIRAIDERLMGKTSEIAKSVTVGDKNIQYLSIDELLKLREFAKQRQAEEEDISSPNDQKIISHYWGGLYGPCGCKDLGRLR